MCWPRTLTNISAPSGVNGASDERQLTHRLARLDDVEDLEPLMDAAIAELQKPFLDPATDPARIRAMYTHPRHARKGVGRLIIGLCEAAARAEGFRRLELMSTMSGEALYRACGYQALEQVRDDRGGIPVPLIRMAKQLES
jgi:GNAT superfamily N-acetyltransferase